MDRPAVAGGVSIRADAQVSGLRPGCEIRVGGPGRGSISEHESCPDLLRKSLAECVAERWVESCRRDLLDHIIALNERHLKRLLADYVGYYHDDRTHLGLGKGTPDRRIRSLPAGRILSYERLGGLHHRYDRAA